jgi:hypothetical protein
MLNRLSNWESNMEAIIGSMQQDVPLHASPTPTVQPHETSTSQPAESVDMRRRESEKKMKYTQAPSSTGHPLEDYDMNKYKNIRNWISRN